MGPTSVPGYAMDTERVPEAPVDQQGLDELKAVVGWTADDTEQILRLGGLLEGHEREYAQAWFEMVRQRDDLLRFFEGPDGEPDQHYMERVEDRFVQWVRDTCDVPYDQSWLDYQFEIGRRHHRSGKNQTDDVRSADLVELRYLITFIHPTMTSMRRFLRQVYDGGDATPMIDAWTKSLILQVALWSHPYANSGDW